MKTNAEINEDNQQKQQTVSGHVEPVVILRQQLYRFGEPYASWGTEDEIIKRETACGKWWWLMRTLGWHIKDEFMFK